MLRGVTGPEQGRVENVENTLPGEQIDRGFWQADCI